MNQALHIFSKDTRHLRWEILVSLALLAAYLWAAPHEWTQSFVRLGATASGSVAMSLAGEALSVLIPVSWWLMITRAVHAENLVGDQQWWVTKPYDWASLLGAKLLFLAAFVFAPIFLVQCLLLARAGFHPNAVLPALGVHLAVLGLVIVLPLLAIATITSTIARSTLTALGVLLAIVAAVAGLVNYAVEAGDFAVSGTGWLFEAVFVAGIGGAIVLQYARRLQWRARLIMLGTVALLIVLALLPTTSSMVRRVYRPTSGPLQFALDTGNKSYAQGLVRNMVAISVPIKLSGIAPGTGVVIEGAQTTLEAPDGQRSTTPWLSQYAGVYLPGDDLGGTGNLNVRTPRWFQAREAGKPLTLHVRFAVAELRAGQPVQIAMPAHEFEVPGFAICTPQEISVPGQFSTLSCRSAVEDPTKTLIQAEWSDARCSDPAGSGATVQGGGWSGSLFPGTGLELNPVVQVRLDLSNAYKMINGVQAPRPRFLCPGRPITFTPYRVVRRGEYDATFANFVMPKQGAQQPGGGYGGYSVGVHVGD